MRVAGTSYLPCHAIVIVQSKLFLDGWKCNTKLPSRYVTYTHIHTHTHKENKKRNLDLLLHRFLSTFRCVVLSSRVSINGRIFIFFLFLYSLLKFFFHRKEEIFGTYAVVYYLFVCVCVCMSSSNLCNNNHNKNMRIYHICCPSWILFFHNCFRYKIIFLNRHHACFFGAKICYSNDNNIKSWMLLYNKFNICVSVSWWKFWNGNWCE